MRYGKGKQALFASMLAIARNAAQKLGQVFDSKREIANINYQVKNAKSGFTSSPEAKKRRARKRYRISFESRRRNHA